MISAAVDGFKLIKQGAPSLDLILTSSVAY
jgi:hypothetical protein